MLNFRNLYFKHTYFCHFLLAPKLRPEKPNLMVLHLSVKHEGVTRCYQRFGLGRQGSPHVTTFTNVLVMGYISEQISESTGKAVVDLDFIHVIQNCKGKK